MSIESVAKRQRAELINSLRAEYALDEAVFAAMEQVPRHEFMDAAVSRRMDQAYLNKSLPIGHEQTISQPVIVACMTHELLQPGVPERVLEIGTGSGYQAAVLSLLIKRVYSVERIAPLHKQATQLLYRLGYRNVLTKHGDGYQGWALHGPYDGILVTAAAAQFPQALAEQLAIGGRLIIPEGEEHGAQTLVRYDRTETDLVRTELMGVKFVPLVAESA